MRSVVGDYVVDLFGKEGSNKEFLIKQSKSEAIETTNAS